MNVTTEMMQAVRMAMLHDEAIKMDSDRSEAIAKHPGTVCQHQYTTDAFGRPVVVLDESEIPY